MTPRPFHPLPSHVLSYPKLSLFIPLLLNTIHSAIHIGSSSEPVQLMGRKGQGSNPMTFLFLLIYERWHFSCNSRYVYLLCLFLSPQPLPLFPSCTRSVPPWGALPCHGHNQSNPMASSWTMKSGTMRRWVSSVSRLARPRASPCCMGIAQLRAQQNGLEEVLREVAIWWWRPEASWESSQVFSGKSLQNPGNFCTNSRENLPAHHPAVWTAHWTDLGRTDPIPPVMCRYYKTTRGFLNFLKIFVVL